MTDMWHLPKPDLQDTLNDVDAFENLGIITPAENPILKRLVQDYDNGDASLTDRQRAKISPETAENIHAHYSDTYAGKRLFFIREELFKNVTFCPYCGINGRGSLDHYMDKSTYKEMSLCRLNLVPMCMDCNRPKSDNPYTDFINPYYFVNPGVEFFICNIIIQNSDVVFYFSIKTNVLTPQQTTSLNNQISVIGLNDRWEKAVISYLQEDIFSDKDTPQILIASLPSLIEKKERDLQLFNHWKTAVLRGLNRVINGNTTIAKQILDAVNNKVYF